MERLLSAGLRSTFWSCMLRAGKGREQSKTDSIPSFVLIKRWGPRNGVRIKRSSRFHLRGAPGIPTGDLRDARNTYPRGVTPRFSPLRALSGWVGARVRSVLPAGRGGAAAARYRGRLAPPPLGRRDSR